MVEISAIDTATLAFFKQASSSLVTDALGRFGLGAWMDDVLPIQSDFKLAGRVRTVHLAPRSGIRHSDHSFYTAAELFDDDDVMVIATNRGRGWLLGENIVHFCQYQRLGGIVTDGKIRDVAEIRGMSFPVFARGVTARPFQSELEIVAVDVPVECGGGYLRSGDLIVGDADGIVIAPAETAQPLIAEVEELIELETRQEKLIRERAPLAEVQEVSRLKKIRKGPALNIGVKTK